MHVESDTVMGINSIKLSPVDLVMRFSFTLHRALVTCRVKRDYTCLQVLHY